MDSERIIGVWCRAIDAWNNDDLEPLADLLTADCVFPYVGESRDDIIGRLKQDRADGLVSHDIVSIAVAGSVLTTIARNRLADGNTHYVGAAARFNDEGKIFYLTAVDESTEVTPP